MLSGKYEDDFESTITAETAESITTCDGTTNNMMRPDKDDDDSNSKDGPVNEASSTTEGAKSSDGDESSGGEEDTLTLSFQDIGALRRSLEKDEMIRESLASNSNDITTNVSTKSYAFVLVSETTHS